MLAWLPGDDKDPDDLHAVLWFLGYCALMGLAAAAVALLGGGE